MPGPAPKDMVGPRPPPIRTDANAKAAVKGKDQKELDPQVKEARWQSGPIDRLSCSWGTLDRCTVPKLGYMVLHAHCWERHSLECW